MAARLPRNDAYGPMSHAHRSGAAGRAVRVLTVDDDPPFLDLLRDVVPTSGLEVVGEADSGERAVELAQELHPEMVLIDVRMPGLDGISAAKRIKESQSSTVVILISTTHPDELPRAATEGVADAVVWKSELRPMLLREIWQRARPQLETL